MTMRATRSTIMPTVPITYVVVDDELTGTRREYDLPVHADEAMKSCVELERAHYFCERLHVFADGGAMSLAVSIRKAKGVILVRWHAVDGDNDRAYQERESELADLEGGSL